MPKGYPKDGLPRKRPRACQVCRHAERQRIEMLHLSGVSLDKLAERFEIHRDALWRHMQRHVSEEAKASYLIGPARIAELAEIAAEESNSVVDYLGVLRSTLFALIDKRAAEGNDQAVATLAQRALHVLKEIGRATGQINTLASSTIINIQNNTAILNSPPFADLQSGLMQICARHPDVRSDIIALMRDLDARYAAQPKAIEALPVLEAAE